MRGGRFCGGPPSAAQIAKGQTWTDSACTDTTRRTPSACAAFSWRAGRRSRSGVTVPPFENVHIYDALAEVLGVTPAAERRRSQGRAIAAALTRMRSAECSVQYTNKRPSREGRPLLQNPEPERPRPSRRRRDACLRSRCRLSRHRRPWRRRSPRRFHRSAACPRP